MKVAVYAICRDEAAFASRFMATAREADVVCIADTGSVDGAPEAFAAEGAVVHFDDARNAALALVPADVDVCVSLDVDEVLSPGWRAALERAWTPANTRASYIFVASHLPDGSPGVQFINNRAHARRGYRWRHACHEGLYPDRLQENAVFVPGMRVDHHPDTRKSRSSYFPLLQAAAREEPQDPRMAHYFARELYYERRWAEAIAEFERYLTLAADCSRAERSSAMIYVAKCQAAQALDSTAAAMRAVAEDPTWREPWVELAEAHYRAKDWVNSYAAAVKALSIPPGANGYMSDPHAHGPTPHDLAAIAASNLGWREEGLRHAEAALALAPEDERLRRNVEALASPTAAEAAMSRRD